MYLELVGECSNIKMKGNSYLEEVEDCLKVVIDSDNTQWVTTKDIGTLWWWKRG